MRGHCVIRKVTANAFLGSTLKRKRLQIAKAEFVYRVCAEFIIVPRGISIIRYQWDINNEENNF